MAPQEESVRWIDNLVSMHTSLNALVDCLSRQLFPLLLGFGTLVSPRGDSNLPATAHSLYSLAVEGLIGEAQFKSVENACRSVTSLLNRCEERFQVCKNHLINSEDERYLSSSILQKSVFHRIRCTYSRLSSVATLLSPMSAEFTPSEGTEGTRELSMAWYLAGIKNFADRYVQCVQCVQYIYLRDVLK